MCLFKNNKKGQTLTPLEVLKNSYIYCTHTVRIYCTLFPLIKDQCHEESARYAVSTGPKNTKWLKIFGFLSILINTI